VKNKRRLKLEKIIKELQHTIDYFDKPNQFQSGRIFEATKILKLLKAESNRLETEAIPQADLLAEIETQIKSFMFSAYLIGKESNRNSFEGWYKDNGIEDQITDLN
jgi:hypothetical protein